MGLGSVSSRVLLALLFVATVGHPPSAQLSTAHSFDKHLLFVAPPSGYKLVVEQMPDPGRKEFIFTSDPRADGTRCVVQVTLFDFTKIGAPPTLLVDQFAEQLLVGMRQTYPDLMTTTADKFVPAMGLPAKRIEWTGSRQNDAGEKVAIKGVMLFAIDSGLGIWAQAFDAAARASDTLSAAEKSLSDLRVLVKR